MFLVWNYKYANIYLIYIIVLNKYIFLVLSLDSLFIKLK